MNNYCAFSKDHKCILWLDYEITRQELEECHTLCHGNWIEIEHKYKYIQELRHLLDEHGIPYPEEYEIDKILFKGLVLYQTLSHTLMKAPLLGPSRRTLNNYAIFYAKPSRKTLNKFGKPSTTLIILNPLARQTEISRRLFLYRNVYSDR